MNNHIQDMLIGTFVVYKGYTGTIEIVNGKHCGHLLNINGLVNYSANSVEELFEEYKKSIDDYIAFLKEVKNRNG